MLDTFSIYCENRSGEHGYLTHYVTFNKWFWWQASKISWKQGSSDFYTEVRLLGRASMKKVILDWHEGNENEIRRIAEQRFWYENTKLIGLIRNYKKIQNWFKIWFTENDMHRICRNFGSSHPDSTWNTLGIWNRKYFQCIWRDTFYCSRFSARIIYVIYSRLCWYMLSAALERFRRLIYTRRHEWWKETSNAQHKFYM